MRERRSRMMHFGNFGGMGFGGSGIGGIFMIIFWVLLIVGVVYLIKYISGTESNGWRRDNAGDVLKRRYASGDITRDEFEEMKRVLSRGR